MTIRGQYKRAHGLMRLFVNYLPQDRYEMYVCKIADIRLDILMKAWQTL